MRLTILEFHKSAGAGALNDEWFVVENGGDRAFSTAGCTIAVGKGKGRLRGVGTLDPGFTLQPKERMRVVSGNPGKKAHGAPPPTDDGGPRNYHLFLAEPLFSTAGAGAVVAMTLKQHEIARAVFDPSAASGVGAEAPAGDARS